MHIDIEVVDDHRDAARSVAELLRAAGHGMNGFGVARHIREDSKNRSATLVTITSWSQGQGRSMTLRYR